MISATGRRFAILKVCPVTSALPNTSCSVRHVAELDRCTVCSDGIWLVGLSSCGDGTARDTSSQLGSGHSGRSTPGVEVVKVTDCGGTLLPQPRTFFRWDVWAESGLPSSTKRSRRPPSIPNVFRLSLSGIIALNVPAPFRLVEILRGTRKLSHSPKLS